MRLRPRVVGIALVALAVVGTIAEIVRVRPYYAQTTEFGKVRVFPAWLRTHGVAFLFSGRDGWNDDDEVVANARARAGTIVVGIDTARFLSRSTETVQGCLYLPGPLEAYSRALQRDWGTQRLRAAELLGRGVGASLVYVAQAQAPVLAFQAAVGINPEPAIPTSVTFCDQPVTGDRTDEQGLSTASLSQNVQSRFVADRFATPSARRFVEALAIQPGNRATAVAPRDAWSLATLYAAALADIARDREQGALADLPLVEVPAAHSDHDAFVVLYSGDGGWRDLDRTLADMLASKGIDVVGVDALRYFWREKPAPVAASDLARVIRHYQARWGHRHVVLVGFSFGADVLPFLFNRLPADLKPAVRLLSLLAPSRDATFEVEPTDWLSFGGDQGTVIEPELVSVGSTRVQCVYGTDEADSSLCTTRAAASRQVIGLQGGHHFDGDYGRLADSILTAIK